MAIYTLEEYEHLRSAYASGVRTVSYGGKTVTYTSDEEMRRRLIEMQIDLGIREEQPRRKYGDFYKGTQKD